MLPDFKSLNFENLATQGNVAVGVESRESCQINWFLVATRKIPPEADQLLLGKERTIFCLSGRITSTENEINFNMNLKPEYETMLQEAPIIEIAGVDCKAIKFVILTDGRAFLPKEVVSNLLNVY